MSTAHQIFSGDCAVQNPASTTPWEKILTGLLFLVSVLSLQGCFLTARVWKEDHPNGIREANVACLPVSAVRDGTGVVVAVRIKTTMATRGYRGYSEKNNPGYADRNLTAGDVVFLKSRPQQPCVPDDRVWKAACSQALSVRVSGKGERWSGSLHNGANMNASLDFQTSRVAFAEIPKPDINAIEALSEHTTWLGRTFRNLLSQPLSGGRQANSNAAYNGRAIPVAFRELDGPINSDLAGLSTHLLRPASPNAPLNLDRYTLIIALRWMDLEVVDAGLWEVNLEQVATHCLMQELRDLTLEEIPASAAQTAHTSNLEPVPMKDSVITTLVWEAVSPYDGSSAKRIALTPLAVVGDAVIIVTAPVWGILAAALILSYTTTYY